MSDSARIQIERAIHIESDRKGVALCGHKPPASQFENDPASHEDIRACMKCLHADRPVKVPASEVLAPFNGERATEGWLA